VCNLKTFDWILTILIILFQQINKAMENMEQDDAPPSPNHFEEYEKLIGEIVEETKSRNMERSLPSY
jgi:hypothetical protein